MNIRVAASVGQRVKLLRDETKRSYELAWSDTEHSHKRAMTRIDELFDAYDEFVRLILNQPGVSGVGGDPWDLVLTIDAEHDGMIELVFKVEPLPPRAAPQSSSAPERDALTTNWGNPFQ